MENAEFLKIYLAKNPDRKIGHIYDRETKTAHSFDPAFMTPRDAGELFNDGWKCEIFYKRKPSKVCTNYFEFLGALSKNVKLIWFKE